jgi:uncharacterized membrane protein YeaQ/YmgE (transglycosylase-associated protein family)
VCPSDWNARRARGQAAAPAATGGADRHFRDEGSPPESTARTQTREGIEMEGAEVGWIAAILLGGIAGWLAERIMRSSMGLLMNILLGMVGAFIANAALGLLGVHFAGWLGYLVAGFVGACALIAVARALRR